MQQSTTSRRSRRAVTLAAAVGCIGLVAGCSGGGAGAEAEPFTGEYDGPEVTLSFWNGFTGGDGPFMQDLVDQFNDEHETITVETNTMEWGDLYQRLPAAVTAGEGPDVGVMHFDQLATNAARQVILPLDDMTETLDLSADDFSEPVWEAGIYDDQRYGVPLDVHSLGMYYNTEHFAAAGITEAPTDAASFEAALDALQAAGYETPFWMPSGWPAHLMWLTLDGQFGGQPYSDDASAATYGDAAGVEALEWMRGMVDAGYSPSDVAVDSQYVAFKNGETSITWDGIWQINDLEESGTPYALAPVPTVGDTEATWASSHQFFLPRQDDGERIDAARVFIAWMSEHSSDWAGAGMIPARLTAQEDGALDALPQAALLDSLDTMQFIPTVPGIGSVQTETLEIAVAEAVLGNGEPETLLSDASDRATELIEENLANFGE